MTWNLDDEESIFSVVPTESDLLLARENGLPAAVVTQEPQVRREDVIPAPNPSASLLDTKPKAMSLMDLLANVPSSQPTEQEQKRIAAHQAIANATAGLSRTLGNISGAIRAGSANPEQAESVRRAMLERAMAPLAERQKQRDEAIQKIGLTINAQNADSANQQRLASAQEKQAQMAMKIARSRPDTPVSKEAQDNLLQMIEFASANAESIGDPNIVSGLKKLGSSARGMSADQIDKLISGSQLMKQLELAASISKQKADALHKEKQLASLDKNRKATLELMKTLGEARLAQGERRLDLSEKSEAEKSLYRDAMAKRLEILNKQFKPTGEQAKTISATKNVLAEIDNITKEPLYGKIYQGYGNQTLRNILATTDKSVDQAKKQRLIAKMTQLSADKLFGQAGKTLTENEKVFLISNTPLLDDTFSTALGKIQAIQDFARQKGIIAYGEAAASTGQPLSLAGFNPDEIAHISDETRKSLELLLGKPNPQSPVGAPMPEGLTGDIQLKVLQSELAKETDPARKQVLQKMIDEHNSKTSRGGL